MSNSPHARHLKWLALFVGVMLIAAYARTADAFVLPLELYLENNTGRRVNNSETVNVTLFTDESAGSRAFNEEHTIQFENGVGEILLGRIDTKAMNASLFNQTLWVSFNVSGQTMQQRMRLGYAPYAYYAQSVNLSSDWQVGRLKDKWLNISDLGIGTDAPTARLFINSTTTKLVNISNTSNTHLFMNATHLWTNETMSVCFGCMDANANRLTIIGALNVTGSIISGGSVLGADTNATNTAVTIGDDTIALSTNTYTGSLGFGNISNRHTLNGFFNSTAWNVTNSTLIVLHNSVFNVTIGAAAVPRAQAMLQIYGTGQLLNITNSSSNTTLLLVSDQGVTVGNNLTLTDVTSCSQALETDSNGNIICGTDAGAADTNATNTAVTIADDTIALSTNTYTGSLGFANLTNFHNLDGKFNSTAWNITNGTITLHILDANVSISGNATMRSQSKFEIFSTGTLLNISNSTTNNSLLTVYGNGSVTLRGSIRVEDNITLADVTSCSQALETDAAGNIICGTDSGSADTNATNTAVTISDDTIALSTNTYTGSLGFANISNRHTLDGFFNSTGWNISNGTIVVLHSPILNVSIGSAAVPRAQAMLQIYGTGQLLNITNSSSNTTLLLVSGDTGAVTIGNNLTLTDVVSCSQALETDANGNIICGTDATGGGGGGDAGGFTPSGTIIYNDTANVQFIMRGKNPHGGFHINGTNENGTLVVESDAATGNETSIIVLRRTKAGVEDDEGGILFQLSDPNNNLVNVSYIGSQLKNAVSPGAFGDFIIRVMGQADQSPLNERLRITADGQIGLGTSNPIAGIHTNSSNTNGSLLAEVTSGGAVQPVIRAYSNKGAPTPGTENEAQIVFNFNTATLTTPTDYASIGGVVQDATSQYGGLMFRTVRGTSGQVLKERMKILDTGLVGIGTTSATAWLSVNGSQDGNAGTRNFLNISNGTETVLQLNATHLILNATVTDNPVFYVGINTTSPTVAIDVGGNARIRGLVSCNTIDTDSSGNLVCGADATGGGGGDSGGFTPSGATLYNNSAGTRVVIGGNTGVTNLNVIGNTSVQGNLSLGTNLMNPQGSILHINGTGTLINISNHSTSFFLVNNSDVRIGIVNSTDASLYVDSRLRRVGIGTTAPIAALDINIESTTPTRGLRVYSSNSAPESGSLVEITAANTGWNTDVIRINSQGTGNPLVIQDGIVDRFIVRDSGAFTVIGNITLLGNMTLGTNIMNPQGAVLHINGTGTLLNLSNQSESFLTANASGVRIGKVNSTFAALYVSNLDARVGIGLTNPQSTLEVNGTVNATNVSIMQNLTLKNIVSCSSTLETDANGNVICGTDETGSGADTNATNTAVTIADDTVALSTNTYTGSLGYGNLTNTYRIEGQFNSTGFNVTNDSVIILRSGIFNVSIGTAAVPRSGAMIQIYGTGKLLNITNSSQNTTLLLVSDQGVTIGNNLTFTDIVSCSSALETDASGNVICGTDETGSGADTNATNTAVTIADDTIALSTNTYTGSLGFGNISNRHTLDGFFNSTAFNVSNSTTIVLHSPILNVSIGTGMRPISQAMLQIYGQGVMLNITNATTNTTLLLVNGNTGTVTIGNNLSLTDVTSCSAALETDSNGVIICGSDPAGGGTQHGWTIGAQTIYNSSAIRLGVRISDPQGSAAINTTGNISMQQLVFADGSVQNRSAGVVIDTFTTNGTWTKPTGAKAVQVMLWGSGGGGAGAFGSTNGGAGGGGGGFATAVFKASDLGATETITVGSGGGAGAAGDNGLGGDNSSFAAYITAYGGAGGATAGTGGGGAGSAATSTSSSGGVPRSIIANGIAGQGVDGGGTNSDGFIAESGGGGGGGGSNSGGTPGGSGGSSIFAGGGGGGGGSGAAGNSNGGAGGANQRYVAGGGGAGGAGGNPGSDGVAGTAGINKGGTGGGGGGGSSGNSNAGVGAAGGTKGGGGGGGGSPAGGTAAAGGAGGRGEVIVITYI